MEVEYVTREELIDLIDEFFTQEGRLLYRSINSTPLYSTSQISSPKRLSMEKMFSRF